MTEDCESDKTAAKYPSEPFDRVVPIDRYIARVANRVGIDWRVQELAREIAMQTECNILLSGKDPVGIAVAYLYMSSCIWGYNIYLADIASFSQVIEITIRTRYKEILESFDLEIRVRRKDSAAVAC